MAWQTEMVRLVRFMINDLDPTNMTYPDTRLQELLVVAAQLVVAELDFTQPFAADLQNLQIVPDPTARYTTPPTRDDSFINLTCMKAACITDRSESKTASNQAVDVRDGSSQVNLRWVAVARLALLDKSWCKAYEDVKLAYMMNRSHIAGAAICGPFRVWAYEGLPWQFDQRLAYPSDGPGTFVF
jgi:hypothetical protein